MKLTKRIILLVFSIVLPLSIGWASSLLAVAPQAEQYSVFIQPSFAPPSWVFAPVWTLLYVLMGVASYLVIINKNPDTRGQRKAGLIIYYSQLVLNFLWTGIFFGLNRFDLAYYEIMVLWIAIAVLGYLFFKVKKISAYLLIPYFVWVGFASFLNLSIWLLN